MSSSIMPPQMLARIIFIFTLITGIVFSAKPNTFWSKINGQPEFSKFIHKDSQDYSKETEKNYKNLIDYITHEHKRSNLTESLPFLFCHLHPS